MEPAADAAAYAASRGVQWSNWDKATALRGAARAVARRANAKRAAT